MIDGAKLTQPECWELAKDVTLGALPRNLATGLEQRGAPGLSTPRVSLAHPPLLCEDWLQVDPWVSTPLGWREASLSPSSGAGEVSRWGRRGGVDGQLGERRREGIVGSWWKSYAVVVAALSQKGGRPVVLGVCREGQEGPLEEMLRSSSEMGCFWI